MAKLPLPKDTRIKVDVYADGTRKYYPQYKTKFLLWESWHYFEMGDDEFSSRRSYNSRLKATKFLNEITLVNTFYLEPQL